MQLSEVASMPCSSSIRLLRVVMVCFFYLFLEIGAIICQESPDTVVALEAFFSENELSFSICQVHLGDEVSDQADFSAFIKDYEYIQIYISVVIANN